MATSTTSIVKPILLVVAIGAIVGVYFYVQREQERVDEFNARTDARAAEPLTPPRTRGGAAIDAASPVENQLIALRAKLARDREAAAPGFDVPQENLTEEQTQELQALRRTFNRSLAGQYSRKQIHITVQALRQMLADTQSPATATVANGSSPAPLSWRVHLLPYIGEPELYDRFRLDESWDSPHNKPLLAEMPMLYRGLYDKADAHVTRLMSVEIPGSLAQGGRLRPLSDVTDPVSETLALIIVGTKLAVPWTSPQDFTTFPEAFAEAMSKMPKPTYWVGTVEGAALDVRFDGRFGTFYAMATIAGGEPNAVDVMIKEKSDLMRSDN